MIEDKLYITRTEKEELAYLLDEIREGTASADDYQNYENLIVNHGLPKSKLEEILKDSKSTDWSDFVKKRENSENINYKKRSQLEGVIVGALIGLGLYLIFRAIVKK